MARPDKTTTGGTCCLVSELLAEAGLDRDKARALRRQLLEGIVLMCRWQLERMDKPAPRGGAPRQPSGTRRGRRIVVE